MALLLSYLKAPSTWKGLVALAIALGVTLSPEQQEAILAGGLGLVGLIQVFVDD